MGPYFGPVRALEKGLCIHCKNGRTLYISSEHLSEFEINIINCVTS